MTTVFSMERHPLHPDAVGDFEAFVHELVTEMRRQPGVLWAEAARAGDDQSFFVLSEWRTRADLDAWEGSPSAMALGDRGDVLVSESPTRRRFVSGD